MSMVLNWSSWNDFIAMGGYGLYVWGSFGVAALTLVCEVVSLHSRRRALSRQDFELPERGAFGEAQHEG